MLRPIAESIQDLGAQRPTTAAASAALLSSLVDTLDTLAKTIRFLDAGSFPKQEGGSHIVVSVVTMFWEDLQVRFDSSIPSLTHSYPQDHPADTATFT